MQRILRIGSWSSAVHDWTLCEFKISAPQYRRNTVTVPGLDGAVDLSDALTGDVHYDMRKLTARLENSSGNRLKRDHWISVLMNALDGTVQQIWLPDDPCRFMQGRLRVSVQYSDTAHASVQITADVEPWKYRKAETVIDLTTAAGDNNCVIRMTDRKPVSPLFQVVNFSDTLKIGSHDVIEPGRYRFPDITFRHGANDLAVTGQAVIRISFREGVL